MAQAIIQQQPVDGILMMLLILNRISVVTTAGWKQMKMILNSPVHVGGNGTHAVLVIGLYELLGNPTTFNSLSHPGPKY